MCTPSTPAQSKERKGSNFAIWQPWLKALGTTVINEKADNTCHIDRNLISGASPAAANDFGRLAAKTLLEATRS